jgi:hypothetical protein
MFEKSDIRYKLAVVWVLVFVGIWVIFHKSFPMKSMDQLLSQIEVSMEKEDWAQAKKYAAEFRESFRKNRVFIQMNNATEALTVFEQNIGQLETSVKHEQDSAFEYIGALRESINLVIKPFSGP